MLRTASLSLALISCLVGGAAAITPIVKGVGARTISLGRAFLGQADDTGAIFLNPAGTANLPTLNLINMYATPFENTRHYMLGGVFPASLLGGTLGLGYNNLTTFQVQVSSGTVDFVNQELIVSSARKVNSALSLGAGFKLLSRGLAPDLSTAARQTGQELDLSLLYELRQGLRLGMNLQNILPETLGGKAVNGLGESEGIPANFRAGLSAKARENIIINLDWEKSAALPDLLHFGSEWWPVKFFALRGGLDQTAAAANNQVFTNLGLGFGLKYAGVTFDYAYLQLGDASRRVEHYFSVGYIASVKVESAKPRPAESRFPPEIQRLLSEEAARAGQTISRGDLQSLLNQVFSPAKLPAPIAKPDQPATRLEGILMLLRTVGIQPVKVLEPPFPDLPGRHRSAGEVAAAKAAGLLKIFGDNLEPQKPLTRAEAAAIILTVSP